MRRKLNYDGIDLPVNRQNRGSRPIELKNCSSDLGFDPVCFLRCHSRSNDDADVVTQVWHCGFEPNNSKIVATCGGNSVCFINFKDGNVEGKYYSDVKDMFYTLCWTTLTKLQMEENILAVAGMSQYIHLLHPKEKVVFYKYNLLTKKHKKEKAVSSLLFHPYNTNVLFCSQSNGAMTAFDIGCPLPPHYKTSFIKLYELSAKSEIFCLAYSPETNVLLAACNEGLRAWRIKEEEEMGKAQVMIFEHPSSMETDSCQLVDSVEVLQNGMVASKCALHGNIYVWDLQLMLERTKKQNTFRITPSYILKWKDTDNYFMNMGFNKNLLVCGDDKGALWIYDTGSFSFGKNTIAENKVIQPSLVLPWPKVEDIYLEKKRKVRLDVFDIVFDKVAVDGSGMHIVAVTNNNMVCIWKKMEAQF